MKIVIDLDGTICFLRKVGEDYNSVKPNKGVIEYITELKNKGLYIIIQTARYMETCNSNIGLINARIGKKTMDWLDNYKKNKVNIVIPMAGAGSRFNKAGYKLPKPFIDVKGKKMLEWAVSSFDFLKDKYELNFIFVVLNKHIKDYQIDKFLKEKYRGCKVIGLDKITRGQAETVLKAKKYINNYEKLIIYNSDTYSDYDLNDFPIDDKNIDGIIPCFNSNDKRYSFAKLDEYGYVSEVVEKKVISNNATNGLYYFRLGKDFVFHAEKMIEKNKFSGGEFYVGPLYNDLISTGKRIKISGIKKNWILGTPEELDYFLKNYK